MSEAASAHAPVLLHEVLELMNVRPGGTYADATYGRGGHTRAILERLDGRGHVLALDRDPQAIAHAEQLAASDPKLTVRYSPFSALRERASELGWRFDGILFDLGVSSPQLDEAARGFSFQREGPLDMRMDPTASPSAADWLNSAPEAEIADVLWRYGDERRSRQIAHRIVDERRRQRLETTQDLARLVRACVRGGRGRIDPATRTFQAVRMFVNNEIGELETALVDAQNLLNVGGRLLVIAFHSIEDRVVKVHFRELDRSRRRAHKERREIEPAYQLVTPRPVAAGEAERRANPRSRSARLRVLERAA